ncbi:MAG: threonine--tRNA ligase [Nitrospirae bacterium]|nr:MAG: threonine--tRNA ligase [Nitrospirota bacterium]
MTKEMSSLVHVRCEDGKSQTLPAGLSAREAYQRIKGEVPADALAVKINGIPRDWNTIIEEDATLEPISFASPEGKEIYRHSSAHLMAQAVKECFPSANLTIGPPIEEGFYYDFAFERSFTPEDLERIEQKAKALIEADLPITRHEMSKTQAIELFRQRGERYKVELLEGIPDDTVSLYQQGEFVDLCRGPHVESTGRIKAFKVLSSAGAYWRGDERNPMLQRIYGTSFPSQEELDAHLAKLEEIKRRDHRKLGKELDLFSIQEDIGPGLILWHPKGARVRLVIEDFWRIQHLRRGYELVYSPHIARLDLWKTSGHLDYYRENMFAPMTVESSEYQLKPMNCPFHIMLYKTHLRSYRDLPIRYGELGTVYRYERSGVLHGLLRVRGFTQDDAHIFCRPDQIAQEVKQVLEFMTEVLRTFGFENCEMYLSTKPDKAVGTDEQWEQATLALATALQETGFAYEVDPGEGVFYGPKIDVKIRDGLGRLWQCSTVQIDFNNPQRFGLSFIGEDGKPHQPIMIHRALLGSIERFFGVLLEHYAGAFPVWLAPVQAHVLPITNKQHDYACAVAEQLRQAGCRIELDLRNEKVGLKIRDAEKAKIPYMLIVGERERQAQSVAVRKRNGQDLGTMTIAEFRDLVRQDEPPVLRGATLSE